MGNKSSRFAAQNHNEADADPSSGASSPSSGNMSSLSPSTPQQQPDTTDDMQQLLLMQRRRSSIERRSTIPMELEDPDDFTVGESAAEFLYADDRSIATIQHPADYDDGTASPLLTALREQVMQFPKEVRNILAGGIAGIVAKSVVAPLDRIKILYQVSSTKFHYGDLPRAVRAIVQEEGFTALWKGNMATMIRVFPYSGIQFMVFDRLKQYFLLHHHEESHGTAPSTIIRKEKSPSSQPAMNPPRNNNNNSSGTSTNTHKKWGLTPIESLVAGMIAGTVSVILTYPLDLTRAQLAVLKKHKHPHHLHLSITSAGSFWSVLTDNYKCRGVPGLFRGISPTLLGILPYSGIAFTLNEQGKREIQHLTGREVTTFERIQCGALAGLVAQTITYPIEVTRRRMQTIGIVGIHNDSALSALETCEPKSATTTTTSVPASASASASAALARPPGLLRTVQDLRAEQGVRGFMKGVSMNWMKGPVAFGISFTAFDHIQKWMESAKEREARLPPEVIQNTANGSIRPRSGSSISSSATRTP